MPVLAELPLTFRLIAVAVLSVVGWELLKNVLRDHLACTYYHREGSDVVVKVKVMPWDKSGRAHFEGQGYTREFPHDDGAMNK